MSVGAGRRAGLVDAAGLAASEENVPLAGLTTLGIGGPARYLLRCQTRGELCAGLAAARERGLSTFILGGGSNLLVADRGYDGLVLKIEDTTLEIELEEGGAILKAGAGLEWDHLVETAVAEGFGGLECLSGIPGCAGAAPIQNIGAYGQEVAETITAVHAVERESGSARCFENRECGFGYRKSRFKEEWRDRYVVVGVDFRLPRRSTGTVRYRDLSRRFSKADPAGPAPSLGEVRRAVLEIRRSKSMILDPEDPNGRSAGSFFINPVVAPDTAEAVRRRLDVAEMPTFPAGKDRVKLSAAWLIERAGFERGYRLGSAGISSRHSLALINRGGARAADLVELARRIRRGVREAADVVLRPEPVFLGFELDTDTLLG